MDTPFKNILHTNTAPSDEDCQHIRELLAGPRNEAARLTEEIERLHALIKELTEKRDNLNCSFGAAFPSIRPLEHKFMCLSLLPDYPTAVPGVQVVLCFKSTSSLKICVQNIKSPPRTGLESSQAQAQASTQSQAQVTTKHVFLKPPLVCQEYIKPKIKSGLSSSSKAKSLKCKFFSKVLTVMYAWYTEVWRRSCKE
ncbi:hypothetical protein B0H16DRAFT_1453530 [Mycena metata]|uniref:Uncharacterized protein n=1 Tax=Mycena metata TaxID=1033252 RepID=A0AAD7NLU2_9AGAR|nr:hypothetical protein B0H16DRAFT_1453530 [Mycena metata]